MKLAIKPKKKKLAKLFNTIAWLLFLAAVALFVVSFYIVIPLR